MSRNYEISPLTILAIKMRALEAQFKLPVYNDEDWKLQRQTEIVLGEIYREIMNTSEAKEISKKNK